jgi:hypothetical protein
MCIFQRNIDQLEALSKKLKAKTLRTEAPSQSIAATRYLYESCCRFSHVIFTNLFVFIFFSLLLDLQATCA